MYIHTYVHIYLHTYIHPYIHTYIHTSIRTCMSTFLMYCFFDIKFHPNSLPFSFSTFDITGAFRQLQMRAECKALYTRALRGYEEQLGAEHPFTLRCVNNLAAIFCEESKFSEAKDLFEQVLEKQEAEFGTDHKDTIVTVGNLAVVNEQLDNY